MIKRTSLFLLIIVLMLSVVASTIYFLNPFNVKSENIRPRLFGFDIYRIPSKSMQPSLQPGDYISVSNMAYIETPPNRNDVVVFYKSQSENHKQRLPFIKRVVAIAGDKVEINKAKVILNNINLKEAYVLEKNKKTTYSQNMDTIIIPKNHVFVLGDNRDNSDDSRTYGPIAETDIIAKAMSILYGKENRSGKDIK